MARNVIDLSGHHWKFEKIRPGGGIAEEFPLLPPEYQGTYFSWNQAMVPGDPYTDLERAGEIDRILLGRNMAKAKWVQEYEYWYMTKFNVPSSMRDAHIQLLFEGVDYSCEVWLNGTRLGEHRGMYSPFSFDITRLVTFEQWFEGSNIVMVKLDPPPRNYRRVAGGKFCFSGDYMPGLVPFGIWRPVKVVSTGAARIEQVRIESALTERTATVRIDAEVANLDDAPKEVTLTAVLEGENHDGAGVEHVVSARLAPGSNTIRLSAAAADPALWWPWDMGDQHLYRLTLTLSADRTDLDSRLETFGIREIRMERNPGFTAAEAEYPWTFMINGRRHFLRSACWGGPPSFFYGRNNKRKYRERLEAVQEANINNLRIFGWHPAEVPYFYDLCDRLGITVWTNFGFATQAFSSDPDFLATVRTEVDATVRERRNHPSTIFWMGGEEVFFSHAHVVGDNKRLMHEIGTRVARLTDVPYAPASPLSGEFGRRLGYKPKESAHANEHYYGAGHTLMEEYYSAMDFCVIPELTAASPPSVASLEKFIPADELWPMGPSWGYHWADITILKLLNVEVFGDPRDGSLEEFVEASQTAHGIIAQYALEHFRRRKPRVSAVALCHFLTYLPDIKWGIVDYYGERKIAFDYVRRAYQPLLVSLEYRRRRFASGDPLEAEIWVVNDFHTDFRALTLRWSVEHPSGAMIAGDEAVIDVEADSSSMVCPVRCTIGGDNDQLFRVTLHLEDSEGATLSSNVHTLMIGDQEAAVERGRALHEEMTREQGRYGKGYYRYHSELWDID